MNADLKLPQALTDDDVFPIPHTKLHAERTRMAVVHKDYWRWFLGCETLCRNWPAVAEYARRREGVVMQKRTAGAPTAPRAGAHPPRKVLQDAAETTMALDAFANLKRELKTAKTK